jgi:hypothetical protein
MADARSRWTGGECGTCKFPWLLQWSVGSDDSPTQRTAGTMDTESLLGHPVRSGLRVGRAGNDNRCPSLLRARSPVRRSGMASVLWLDVRRWAEDGCLSVEQLAAQQLDRLCEKSGRWGPVPWGLRGLTRKWRRSDLQARDPGLQWERESRFWGFHAASRCSWPRGLPREA